MKQLYFIRHGLSELNKVNAMAGHTDTPLTEEGHQQAKLAGKKARERGMSFDIIVSSPLQRAHHTAAHVAKAIDYPQEKIEVNKLFKERNFGSIEGKPADKIGVDYFADESAIDHLPEVETLQQLQRRANRALAYLHELGHDTVLVVAHGSFGRALYRAVKGLPITERDIRYQNAEFIRFL